MVNVMERSKKRLDASWLNHSVTEALNDYQDGRAHTAHPTPASFSEYDDAALPSMFRRPKAATAASEPHCINGKSSFSPYVIILFFVAIVPIQTALLTSRFSANEEPAIEPVLALAREGAALLSIPSAEAAASFEDGRWNEAVDTLKLLLAKQTASAMRQAENDRLLGRLEMWVNARTQKPATVADACTVPSALNCWKTSIQ